MTAAEFGCVTVSCYNFDHVNEVVRCCSCVTCACHQCPDPIFILSALSNDCMQVWGMLLEARIGDINGFDLSALNVFRWHPHHEKVDLSRWATTLLLCCCI